MRHVDLCSGIGGFALGFEQAQLSSPVLFCDIDPWCRKILAQHWPDVPIADDVKELANDPDRNVPDCDILTAGYPCQPFSVAGKRKGAQDDRHIWPYIRRIVAQKRPTWCVFENVYGHISMGLDEVLSDLETEGYATRPFIVPACGVNAPHKRDRLWIVAHTDSNGEPDRTKHEQRMAKDVADTDSFNRRAIQESQGRQEGSAEFGQPTCNSSGNVADTNNTGSQGRIHRRSDQERQDQHGHAGRSSSAHRQPNKGPWDVEPELGRVAHGIPNRTHRLKGLGNAIVPQIAEQIALTIRKVSE